MSHHLLHTSSRRYGLSLFAIMTVAFFFSGSQWTIAAVGEQARGIFTTDSQGGIDSQVLALPYVDGALIRTHWSTSEPSKGTYDFDSLCTKLTAIHNAGKKASLVTYMDAPSWVVDQIPTNETWTSPLFKNTQPVPWSSIAQKHMQDFINAEANFVCDGYALKNHPAIVHIDTGVLGIQAIRQAPTYTLSTMSQAIRTGVNMWYDAFGTTNHIFYSALFPIGSTPAKVSDAVFIRDAIIADHPRHHFFQETWTGSGPAKGDLASVLAPGVADRAFAVMLQACGIWSNTAAIPCNFSSPDSPQIGYDHVATLYQTTYMEFYPADLKYPPYQTMFENIHAAVWATVPAKAPTSTLVSNPIPTPAPASTATKIPSNTFTINDHIRVASGPLNVRSAANGTLRGTQAGGILGTIVGGPVVSGAFTWWNINYNNGIDGWSAEDFLTKATAPIPTQTLNIKDRVQVHSGPLHARSSPGGTITGSQPTLASGTIIDGPITIDGLTWWKINYETGADGWSAGDYLRLMYR